MIAAAGPYPMGLMGLLATVTMLFAAFTAALLVRRAGVDWEPLALPGILWVNTVVLLASSVLLERARSALNRSRPALARARLRQAALLGLLFLAGQVIGWRWLVIQGVFLRTGPHAAFLYLLSAVHAAHLVGGLAALGWALRRLAPRAATRDPLPGLSQVTLYWHFVGGLWLYLFGLLLWL